MISNNKKNKEKVSKKYIFKNSSFRENKIQKNILLFDDDIIFCQMIKKYAKRKGLSLRVCHNIDEFKKQWDKKTPQLLIVDYELDEHLKGTSIVEATGEVPVLLISRKSQWMNNEEGFDPSIHNFFHKKYGAEKLIEKAIMITKKHSDSSNMDINRLCS